MKTISKLICLPYIPNTQKPSKTFNVIKGFLILILVCIFFSSYIFPIYNPLRLYVFWFIYIVIRAISNYFAHKKDIIKDLYFRRFIYFDATLDEINAIENSVTAYNYQIKLSTSENIPQNQNEFWWV